MVYRSPAYYSPCFPQYIVGLILLFPHAILHEAGITFLGYGLPRDTPAVGIILSESMKYLSAGMWWLAVFPGIALLITVQLFDIIGDYMKFILTPTVRGNRRNYDRTNEYAP